MSKKSSKKKQKKNVRQSHEAHAHTVAQKKNEPHHVIKFSEKIHLEKNSHSYFSALQKKYGKHLVVVEGPLRKVLKVVGIIVLLMVLFVMALYMTFGKGLPDVSRLKDLNLSETTHIMDRNGNELYRIFGKENREYVKLAEIAPDVVHATIAIEDKNFYHHFGFDPIGIIRAQLKNFQDDSISQGASTITQQLAKNIFLSPERTYDRKIKELLLALEIEVWFSKDDILELYFNKIAYGSNSFGIEAAAHTFFGDYAKNLSLVQASVLASLPKAPSYYSPYGPHVKELMGYCKTVENVSATQEKTQEKISTTQESTEVVTSCTSPFDPNYVWGRKDYVLQRMVDDGYIKKEQMVQAWSDGFHLKFFDPKFRIEDPHFVFFVKDYLTQKYGKDVVENGGLQVKTTLDPNLQKIADEAIQNHVGLITRYGANNAAMVALDPTNGQILAMIGSRNYRDPKIDGQVNVTISPRQPGSSFKPLVYGAAIQNAGIGSGTVLGDYKTIFNKNDTPNDYDGNFLGPITIRQAIGGSRNIPAIKAYYVAGEEEKVLDFVDKLGVTSLRAFREAFNKDAEKRGWTFYFGWPMAIGSGEIRLLELVNAYATFANQGKYNVPNPILEVRDRNGVLLESFQNGDGGKQVIDPQIAFIINDILSDVSVRPPGSWRALLTVVGKNLAAKTGTSNKKLRGGQEVPNNNITVGYTPSIAAGFWVGNTDGKNLVNSAYSLYTTDPIFHEFFEKVLKDKPREEFVKPVEIKQIGREYYPSWTGRQDFEKMFKRATQETQEVPLSDFLKNTPEDVRLYQQTLDMMNSQQNLDAETYARERERVGQQNAVGTAPVVAPEPIVAPPAVAPPSATTAKPAGYQQVLDLIHR